MERSRRGGVSVLGTEAARRGILLPAMLLLIVAITLIAHGALVLAEAELEVSNVARAALTARLSAEAGVVTAMEVALGIVWNGRRKQHDERDENGQCKYFRWQAPAYAK